MDAAQLAQQTAEIQAFIANLMVLAATIAGVSGLVSFSATEVAKKVGLSTKFAGLFSYVVGFGVTLLFCKLFRGHAFDTFAIVLGIIVAFVPSGAYSGIKSLGAKASVN